MKKGRWELLGRQLQYLSSRKYFKHCLDKSAIARVHGFAGHNMWGFPLDKEKLNKAQKDDRETREAGRN